MPTPLVETRELSKYYGAVVALDGCTLEVAAGEVLGLLGPNGSGKTTLLRLLMGFLRPSRGVARIAGLECFPQSVEVHHQVAYLPGEPRLPGSMRGDRVLRFFSELHPAGSLRRALDLAARLELDLSRRVAQCSTGMRQKLALAAALAVDVPLLILDEPSSNLDPTVRSTLLTLVREAREQGRAVLFSSHVLSETEQVCDRVCILKQGRLVHLQPMAQLRTQHRIRAQMREKVETPALPPAHEIRIEHGPDGLVTMTTPGELAPLLGWLATLPLTEVQIEPIGLQAVYDLYHQPEPR